MARRASKKIAKPGKVATRKRAAAPPRRRAAAKRGLAAHEVHAAHPDDNICACDFVFTDADATPDSMLPVARGGVDEGRARRG